MRVLFCLSEERRGLGVSELAETVGMTKTTAHRMLSVLEDEGLILANPVTHRYEIGYGLVRIASKFLSSGDLPSTSLPYLHQLRDQCGETVVLSVRLGYQRIALLQVESTQELRCSTEIGSGLPLCKGALGKVLLAHLPPEDIEEIIQQYLGPTTIETETQKYELLTQLHQIREQGYAISHGERMPGGVGIAAPVKNPLGTVVASIAAYGPDRRLTQSRIQVLLPLVEQAAASISQALSERGT